jgi:hypothetical protein
MVGKTSESLIKNGLAGLLLALIGGFMLTFKMLGGISFSPVPIFIDYDLPGTVAGWRAVHLGMLLNGMMAIVIGTVVRLFVLADGQASTVRWGVLIALWGNFCFYLFSMFGYNHGLTLGANRLGEGNWAGAAAFIPAVVGAVTLITVVIVLLRAPIKPPSN